YLALGQNSKVIQMLDSVARDEPDDLTVSYLLGTALIRDDQLARGQFLLDRILRNGDSAEARLLMGTAKLRANDATGARAEFARAVELNPKLPEANAYYALVLLRAGDTARAATAFRSELAVNPNDFQSNLQLGGLLRQDHDYAEARILIERALSLRPGD